MQRTVNNFYEKTVNSFTYCKKQIYECNKQIRIYRKYDVHRANFINVETDFCQCRKIKLYIVKFKHEKAFRFGV